MKEKKDANQNKNGGATRIVQIQKIIMNKTGDDVRKEYISILRKKQKERKAKGRHQKEKETFVKKEGKKKEGKIKMNTLKGKLNFKKIKGKKEK